MSSKEPIHSGHFMTSNPHTEIQVDDEDEDVEVDVVDVDEGSSAVQPIDKSIAKEKDEEKPITFYKFGPQKTQSIVIDKSLNKLNKCIRVAYMKMTTPKWKDFKGLKLQWKQRIRLNNVIWRAYYMEFRKPDRKGKAPYCYFSVPDDDTTHTKIEGSVMEGMYWKRRMEAVCAQYKRWRAYNRNKAKKCCRKRENSCGCDVLLGNGQNGAQGASQQQSGGQQIRSMTPENLCSMGLFFDFDDDLDNEFTNQLFEQLNAPFLFPNPKEGGVQCANADIMQPGLLSLQPSIEEIMSTDYPFAGDETAQLVDPVEFANSLPVTVTRGDRETSSGAPSAGQSAQQYPYTGGKKMPPEYTEKEYDVANMLVRYSAQPVHQPQPQNSLPSTADAPFRHPSSSTLPVQSQPSVRPSAPPPVQPAMPVPVITPNISHPLYSQASAYEAQRINVAGQQRGTTTEPQFSTPTTSLESLAYSNSRAALKTPSMATKVASQLAPQPNTSMATSAHFLSPPSFEYQLLAACTTASSTLAQSGGAIGQTNPAWHWFPQQQQSQLYVPPQPVPLGRKTSANSFPRTSPTPPVQLMAASLSPFTTVQSLVQPGRTVPPQSVAPQAPSLSSLMASQQQNGGRQSALSLHLQQAPKQPASLAGPTTVRQLVMNDLTRYLSQQQSPIAVQPSSAMPTNSGLALHSQLSPIGAPHYSPATTPISAPILGALQQHQQQQVGSNCSTTQPPHLQHHPFVQLEQQQRQMASPFSPPPAKKASTATLPPPSSELQQPLPRRGRGSGSFSGAQRPSQVTKRQQRLAGNQPRQQPFEQQLSQQTTFGGEQQEVQVQHEQHSSLAAKQQQDDNVSSRRWLNRRQTSSSSSVPNPHLCSPPPNSNSQPQQQLQQLGGQLVSRHPTTGRTVSELLQRSSIIATMAETKDEQQPQMGTMAMATLLAMEQVKEEGALDEKPIAMGHKRRHHQQAQGPGSAHSSAGTSSSQSEPADSTLHPEERKRILHLHAEKNRRCALKEGFETLVQCIPGELVEQTGVKCTNAVVLNRAAQYIRSLKNDEEQQQGQLRALKEKITSMNERIALIQSNLPSTSATGNRGGADSSSPSMRIQVEQFFERYKRERSREDYRYWLMGEVLKPIVHSYAEQVHPDASERDRLLFSVRKWLDLHWNTAVLRPIASDKLVRLATASGAFTNESALSNYIMNEVRNSSASHP